MTPSLFPLADYIAAALPAPNARPPAPRQISRHRTVADMTSDSHRFYTARRLEAEGWRRGPLNRWYRGEPPDWNEFLAECLGYCSTPEREARADRLLAVMRDMDAAIAEWESGGRTGLILLPGERAECMEE